MWWDRGCAAREVDSSVSVGREAADGLGGLFTLPLLFIFFSIAKEGLCDPIGLDSSKAALPLEFFVFSLQQSLAISAMFRHNCSDPIPEET